MARKKMKIPVASTASGLTVNPFAALAADGLPDGPMPAPNASAQPPPLTTGEVILRREKAHRGGKTVVVVGGFDPVIDTDRLEDLARKARQSCGCGGTLRDREIELQGDDVDRVRKFFEDEDFRVRGVRTQPR